MLLTGDRDPRMRPEWRQAHDAAVARGERLYRDPTSGYMVMTAAYLAERPCCGNGCRHCPYDEDAQKAAGRPRP